MWRLSSIFKVEIDPDSSAFRTLQRNLNSKLRPQHDPVVDHETHIDSMCSSKIKQEDHYHHVVFKKIGNYALNKHYYHICIPVNLPKNMEMPEKAMEKVNSFVKNELTSFIKKYVMYYRDQ